MQQIPGIVDVSTDREQGGLQPTSRSTATPPRGSACASRTSTTRSTTPSRSGRSRPSTPSATSTASSSRSTRACSAIPSDLKHIYVPGTRRRAGAADGVIRVEQDAGAAGGQPPGAVPGRHHQLQSRRRTTTLDEALRDIDRRWPSCTCPTGIRAEAAGDAKAFAEQASAAAAADPRRAARGLHRARRALREPGAPADHHLDAALGGARRAAGAARRRHGAVGDRASSASSC